MRTSTVFCNPFLLSFNLSTYLELAGSQYAMIKTALGNEREMLRNEFFFIPYDCVSDSSVRDFSSLLVRDLAPVPQFIDGKH